jgi:hypothetical protein
MPSKQTLVLLVLFVLRHSIGILAFLWLASVGRQVGGIWPWLLPILAIFYTAFAFYNGNKLYRQYRRTQAREQQEAARNAAH